MVAVGPHHWNATIIAVDGDEITTRFGVGETNYRWSGAWHEIRNEFREDGVGWINDESKWSIYCPRYADERTTLVNENAWDVANNCEIMPDGNAIIEFDSPYASHVEGEIDPLRPGRILYRNAYGPNVHKAVGKWHGRSVRGEGLPIVEAMPAGDQDAVFVERIITPMRMFGGWDGSLREIGATGCVLTTLNGDAGIRVLPAKAWYYTPDGELVTIPISVTVERVGGYVILRKTIPRWFCAAALAVGAVAMADETTTTFSPDANVEVYTVDGYAARSVSPGESFAAITAGAGTTFNDQQSQPTPLFLSADSTPNRYLLLRRGFTLFNTDSIGSTNVVSSGSYGIYGVAKNTTLQPTEVCLVSSNPASNTAIAASDFGSVGSTEFATRKTGSSWSITGYNIFTLNAAGIANINTTGISKFGLRLGCDLDGVEVNWVGSTQTNYQVYFAENGTNKPYLTLTYAPALRVAPLVRGRSRIIGGGVL